MRFRILLLLFTTIFYASSALSTDLYRVTQVSWDTLPCVSVGDEVSLSSAASCLDGASFNGNFKLSNASPFYGGALSGIEAELEIDGNSYGRVSVLQATRANKTCLPPKKIDPSSGKCVEEQENQCPEGQTPDLEGNCLCSDGSKPNALGQCDDYCQSNEFNALKKEKMILCTNRRGKFSYSCKSRNDVTWQCDETGGGDNGGGSGGGDNGGGSGSGSGGGNPDPKPDPDPDKPSDNKDVVAAIDGMKSDSNTRLDTLSTKLDDIKKSNEDKSDKLKKSVDDASEKSETSLKNIDNSVGKVTNAVNGLGNNIDGNSVKEISRLNAIKNAIESLKTSGKTFKEPEAPELTDKLKDGLSGLEKDIKDIESDIETRLSKSPFNMGEMHFNNGSYKGSHFVLDNHGRNVSVDFSLMEKIGPHIDLIRGVIILVATLIGALIVLSSGRVS